MAATSASQQIRVGGTVIRFLIDGEQSGGSVLAALGEVPRRQGLTLVT